jgi:hypothetical protein
LKINWHENPLKTSVILDEAEKKIFAEKLKVRELKSAAQYAALHLRDKDDKFYDPDRAHSLLQFALDEEGLAGRTNYMLVELESGFHCGDCTCVATSCEKCFAEEILEINTLEGLSQSGGHQIDVLYGREGVVGIEQVLAAIEIEIAEALDENRQEHHRDAVAVYEWLLRYKIERLGFVLRPLA